MDITSRKH